MSQSTTSAVPDSASLPDSGYTLIEAEKLVYGRHNPRNEVPKRELKQSIEGSGMTDPLIVWYESENDEYHITDGWQRYQAATELGWEMLPAEICDTALEALDKTGGKSAGRREWNKYDWAHYCKSLAEEIGTDEMSKTAVIQRVAERADRTEQTVRRYLNVLELPDVIHRLLKIGPEATNKQWEYLRSFNEDVRQYSGLTLDTADVLADHQSSVTEEQLIGIASYAVEFGNSNDTIGFIEKAVEDDDVRLDMIQREIYAGSDHNQFIIVPRVKVKLPEDQRRALMDYCLQHKQQPSDIVADNIKSLASEITEDDTETDTNE
jgi:ParB/RepB/Spo0J family partition protein